MGREEWAVLDAYPNYAVSNHGEVINIKFHRTLKARPNTAGYMRVTLWSEGESHDYYVHQLVASLFLLGFTPRTYISHRDGDRSNNHVDNLIMRTHPRKLDASKIPTRPKQGHRVRIVETDEVFLSARHCAAYIGGDFSTIYACIRNPGRTHKGYTYEFYEEH